MTNKDVPFVQNTADDLHCLPAAYMSVAKYFDASFDVDMDTWSEITGFEEDKGTWANAGLVWFKDHGYDVKHIALFDYDEFVKRPKEYLYKIDGEEVGQWAFDHSNIPKEIERIKKLQSYGVIERREPTIADIKQLLDEGYLLRIGLNSSKLNGREGYAGHAVVVFGYDDEHIIFHDPGIPPAPNRKATYVEFENAWADPNEFIKELDAIRLVR